MQQPTGLVSYSIARFSDDTVVKHSSVGWYLMFVFNWAKIGSTRGYIIDCLEAKCPFLCVIIVYQSDFIILCADALDTVENRKSPCQLNILCLTVAESRAWLLSILSQ